MDHWWEDRRDGPTERAQAGNGAEGQLDKFCGTDTGTVYYSEWDIKDDFKEVNY